MKTTTLMAEKKAKNLERLTDRYYGKKDILESWEERPAKVDPDYIRDLKRRLRSHQNDLCYRGVDGFTELAIPRK